MTNEDYQLEELENAAVNKSNNAKRIAAAAGLFAAGGAAGYAATHIPMGEEEIEVPDLDEDQSGVDAGANQVHEPEPKPQPTPQPTQPTPEPEPEEPEVTFDKTTHYYDEDHNLLITEEEGTIDGKKFSLYDVDGDLKADALAYDENGNGVYDDNEFVALEGRNQIAMGNEATQHEDIFFATNDPEPEPEPITLEPYYIDEEKDYADNTIHNDFEDEKTGESYSHDYAYNNDDYNNGEYSAHSSDGSSYAYDDAKDDSDYGYSDLAADDTTDDTFDDLGPDSLDIV